MNARRTQALRQRDDGLARPVGVRFRPCSLRPLKVGDVYFGHFFYRRLHIVKVRQEHFALKRRVRFRCHVVAVVDTLD
jgi:hypothetical protein